MYIALFIIIFILFLTIALAAYSLAPWVPSHSKDLKRISKLADMQDGETFYDLGCGDGKIIWRIAKNQKVKTVGIELALPMYLICKFHQLVSPRKNIKIIWGNVFKKNLSEADAIFIFGTPWSLQNKFKEKLKKELKKGARVISYTFPIKGWQPVKVDKPNKNDNTIYLYKI